MNKEKITNIILMFINDLTLIYDEDLTNALAFNQ